MSDHKGCVGIYTDKAGRVIASASDFLPDTYGGCSLFESQKVRTERRLSGEVVRQYCSTVVSDALDGYACEELVRKLGGTMTFIPIGHEAERG